MDLVGRENFQEIPRPLDNYILKIYISAQVSRNVLAYVN